MKNNVNFSAINNVFAKSFKETKSANLSISKVFHEITKTLVSNCEDAGVLLGVKKDSAERKQAYAIFLSYMPCYIDMDGVRKFCKWHEFETIVDIEKELKRNNKLVAMKSWRFDAKTAGDTFNDSLLLDKKNHLIVIEKEFAVRISFKDDKGNEYKVIERDEAGKVVKTYMEKSFYPIACETFGYNKDVFDAYKAMLSEMELASQE